MFQINAEDIEELINLALRDGALTAGERKNVNRIKDEYIASVRKMIAQQAAEKKQAEEAAAEKSKQEAAKLQAEKQEAAKLQAEKQEAAKLQAEKQEAEKQEAAKLQAEKISGKDFTPRVAENGNHQKKTEATNDPAADLQSQGESV